jgi:hypothetical protein
MELMEQLHTLEGALRKLILDWERFFAGDIKVPPHADRDRLGRRLRTLTEHPSTRRVEQFRLEQLQHKFMTYCQLWERQLREREEGRRGSGVQPAVRPTVSPPNKQSSSSVSERGDSLFERYSSARQRAGESMKLDREAFDRQIARQREQLEKKLGKKVRFDVIVDGKRVKLSARPVRGDD